MILLLCTGTAAPKALSPLLYDLCEFHGEFFPSEAREGVDGVLLRNVYCIANTIIIHVNTA